MKRLLLTGFEPFLDNPLNPTVDIAKKLDGEEINHYKIIGKVLPVAFDKSGPTLLELIEQHNPDVVVSLGLAAGRNCITPERIAINCNDGPADNNGDQPNGERIFAEGSDGYFSTLPTLEIVRQLQHAHLPAKISNTAGAYLCNNVMYHALHHFKQNNLNQRAGFIHIPASHALAVEKNMPSWSDVDLLRAIKIAITCL